MRREGRNIFIAYNERKPIPVLDGYKLQSKHLFVPILDPCDYRIETYHNENCCGRVSEKPIITYKCVATDMVVTSRECLTCQGK